MSITSRTTAPIETRLTPRVLRQAVRRESLNPTNWVLTALIASALIIGATTTRFFTLDNAKAIFTSAGTIGIPALGVTLIMVCGGLVSFAVGQTAAIGGMIFLIQLHLGLVAAIVLATLVGAGITAVQGWLVGSWRTNPIILTIAAASMLTAAGGAFTRTQAVQPTGAAYELLNSTPLGVPVVVFTLIGLTAVLQWFMTSTRIGLLMYAAGESRDAARAAGLPVAAVITVAFALAGALIALSGAFSAAASHTITLEGASQLTFNATAAVLAGGTAIAGGFGSATRTLFGTILIATISDLLLLRGAGIGLQVLTIGVLVFVVVMLSHTRSLKEIS